ncbi:SLATT domain-containing protein [Micromonospora sp. NPDC049751]|uniref:SLATT domain-containing protein n=1 Tax=unclassified Micromonospora TaxID=2617518 RepID=UPI0033EA5B21
MVVSESRSRLEREYSRLYEDCNYSSLTYFNAAKSTDFWAKNVVFVPAVVSAAASLLVALGQSKQWAAVSALASAIVATATFMGSSKRADSLKDSAKRLTNLRHKVRLEMALAPDRDLEELERTIRDLRDEYSAIVASNETVSDRFFTRAQKQMSKEVLEYEDLS